MTERRIEFVLALHSHLPYVLNHGRWPHGSDWLCEAAIDSYLPLLEVLQRLAAEGLPASTGGLLRAAAGRVRRGTELARGDR
jgi:Glycosyl hydrolase family 57